MKTTASQPRAVTSPTRGSRDAVSGARADAYLSGVGDALARAGLLHTSTGLRSGVVLDAANVRKLLQLPEVAADVGRFVKEGLLGAGGFRRIHTDDPTALAPLARALGAEGQWDTNERLRREMFEVFLDQGPARLEVDRALVDAYALGAAGTTAVSGASSFGAGAPGTAAAVSVPAGPAPERTSSALGRLLEGASFASYEQPAGEGTLTLTTRGGDRATVTLALDVFGDRTVSASFAEPGPIPTVARASRKDLQALVAWFEGQALSHPTLEVMMGALQAQLSGR